MKITKWGIIGPGTIAHHFANDLGLLRSPQQVQAVLGHTKNNTESFAKEFAVPQLFSRLEDFVENADIDIVYIATPHTLHYEEALECLHHRIPVLCEKPMAINLEQCNGLISTAEKNKTFLMEGMWIRFLPSIRQLLHIIERGDIGRIVSIKASMSFKAPYNPASRYFDPDLGGGSLLDLGIYPVFLSLLLIGKPSTVKAIGNLSDKGVDEDCSVLLHYKSGQHAILESSLTHEESHAEITGEKGIVKILNPWFEKSAGIEVHLFDEGTTVYPCQWYGHGLQFEAEEALRCLNEQKISSDMLPHEFSRTMIAVMDEIRRQIHVTYDLHE